MTTREIGGRQILTQREEKILFPDLGITKGAVLDYYQRIAEVLLPHLRARPLTLRRFPDGTAARGFFQKEASDHFPHWIERVRLEKREGGSQRQVVANEAATLVYLANQATIELHTWLSRAPELAKPDRLVWDLDPADGSFAPVRRTARLLRRRLDDLGLPSFCMLTGSTGAHVVVPLQPGPSFDETRALARGVAARLAADHPGELTLELRKKARRGRLFLDITRNAWGQTTIAPYSLRARPGAPVAAPIDWDELGRSGLCSPSYRLDNIFRRLAQKPDPWREIDAAAVEVDGLAERL